MSAKQVAADTVRRFKQINTDRGRRYEVVDTDGTTYLLPSVTEILKIINKPALINWSAKTEREAVVHAATQMYLDAPLKPPMSEAAYRTSLLARLGKDKAHIKQMESAAAIGSNVHAVIEWHLRRELGQKVLKCPELLPEAVPCFGAYQAWAMEHELRPLLIEQTVWSRTGRYAGTMDVLAEATMNGKRTIVVLDWKCLLPEQTLRTASGSTVRADEVMPGDELLAWDGSAFVVDRVSSVSPGGVQPCVDLRTVKGRSLCVSANHPVLANGEWVEAGQLVGGEELVVCDEQNADASFVSVETAELLGYLVGDGGFTGNSRRFCTRDSDIKTRVEWLCDRHGFTMREDNEGNYRIGGSGDFLRHHGLLGCGSAMKRIPSDVMSGSREAQIAFLSAYFDCDGYISKTTINRPDVMIMTVSKRLAQETLDLLWRLGIRANAWEQKNRRYKNEPMEHPPWWIKTSSRADAHRFLSMMSKLTRKKKAERRDEWMGILGVPSQDQGPARDQVKSVTQLGNLATIAIEMERTATFVTSGFVTHNTSSGIWKEYRLQIAAYARAIHEMGHTSELPGGLIVRLPKAKKPGESTEPEFCFVPAEEHGPLNAAFDAARNLWAWIEGEE